MQGRGGVGMGQFVGLPLSSPLPVVQHQKNGSKGWVVGGWMNACEVEAGEIRQFRCGISVLVHGLQVPRSPGQGGPEFRFHRGAVCPLLSRPFFLS